MNKIRKSHIIATVIAAATMGMASGSAMAAMLEVPLPEPDAFTTTIDNQYWPLPIGTFAYMAETEDGCEYNKLTITGVTEAVNGYMTLVVRDQEWESEECDVETATLAEDTLDFYAMEKLTQNVWYFGEDTWSIDEDSCTEDGENCECTDDGAWLAGVDEAEPGIVMLGSPTSGDRYQQEYWEDEAEDWGAVLRLNATVSIDYGDFEACLMTREWTPLEPGEIEHKFYCPEDGNPGPGLMFIEELKGKTVYVEFIGADFGALAPAPGEGDSFPALDVVGSCTLPN